MKKKTFTSTAVAVALVTTMAAGCSNSDDTGKSGANGSKDAAAANTAKKPLSLSMSFYDRGNIPPEVGKPEENLWTKYLAEKTGVKLSIVPVPRNESVQKLNTLVASGSPPDLMMEYDGTFRTQLYTQKMLMPIDDAIDKYSTTYKELLAKFPLLKKLATREDGKMYDFGRVLGYVPFHYVLVRQDWLDKLHLQNPKTTDELYQVAKAFATQDPDGNGKNDTYGLNLSTTAPSDDGWVNYMFQNVDWVLANGKWTKDWDRAEAAAAFKKKLFDEGLVDKDFLTDKNGKKAEQDFVTGKTGVYGAGGNLKALYTLYQTLRKNVPDAKLVPIALPASQFGQFTPDFNPPVQLTGVMYAKAKDPEAAVKMVDFLSSQDWVKTTYTGIEGTHYKTVDGKAVAIDPEKNKKELDWLGDYRMLGGQYVYNEFDTTMASFDQSKPFDKEVYDLGKQMYSLYITKDRPLARITLPGFFPTLPADMNLVQKNLLDAAGNPIKDVWSKAIVSGSSYSIAQAKQDAQNIWKKSDGDKLESWYADWYTKNKDTMISQQDLVSMNFK
ncbi:extracellular solute-binding protein [Paenibacillus oryzisoli]|uniref:extracellular solute-binding protein n=1 Tax=Paenibacillus oryzisoli TaxID=1850517 RepID=UPI003D2C5485